ncbi:MAG: GDSL-like Lipase/Acylhydrolase [Lentisphaerae bacterium ADurb.Bin242]|nr:MAG: GDSL-like Lipase/Acylhydrolase [Lentisphaerae bacterium ADurb.Bin242]
MRKFLSGLKHFGFTRIFPDKSTKLLLPPVLYAVPGIEANVYFRNVFLTVNPDHYAFQVKCPKGRCHAKRWSFIPEEKDAGMYDWSLSVLDDRGIVESGTMKLAVVSRKPGLAGGKSILLIGDSLTDHTHYVKRIHELLPELEMIGSHAGAGEKPVRGGVAHEGYGGWSWASFAREGRPEVPETGSYRTNRFVREQPDGRWKLDFPAFFSRYNQGRPPEIAAIQLGTNDIAAATDENRDETISGISRAMDRFLGSLREAAPNTWIGIGLVPPPADQDAFGTSYQCLYHSWQYRKNAFALNRFYLRKISAWNDPKIRIIPTCLNLDAEHNFPTVEEPVNAQNPETILRQSNGLHPAESGYYQIGDTFASWLTSVLQYYIAGESGQTGETVRKESGI